MEGMKAGGGKVPKSVASTPTGTGGGRETVAGLMDITDIGKMMKDCGSTMTPAMKAIMEKDGWSNHKK